MVANLLDPFGNTLMQTEQYRTAKDGLARAQASGEWHWTSKLTPGAANSIVQASGSKSAPKKTAVKGASTSKSGAQGRSSTADAADTDTSSPVAVHRYILALIIAAAVGYGLYEYRHDLANKLHQL